MAASSPTHAFPGFITPVLHTTIFPSNWLLFHIDLAHWWKTNDACRIDFCQSSERKLAEPGFKLTTPGSVHKKRYTLAFLNSVDKDYLVHLLSLIRIFESWHKFVLVIHVCEKCWILIRLCIYMHRLIWLYTVLKSQLVPFPMHELIYG